ncbi:uncharacterized protein [Danio rerio]|uniref:Si:rp71-36a1.5 n=1 Tax=Danio rerio TaxID=7955 RepID=E7F0A4_DANRE|nr:uncharacterized protein LOC101882211 isoform X1 [Danio rerio]|eukprot:XP_005161694.1 uncharacterized protein LOC101882211 isoform X1 [Danio rerio]
MLMRRPPFFNKITHLRFPVDKNQTMSSLFLILLSIRFILPCHGDSAAETILAKEGQSVNLDTGVEKTQQDRIRWYFKDTRIAQINGDPSKTCTDVQCNEGNENFRDRLKLDHQTGSLTIMNIRNTDAGDYQLKFYSSNSISEKTFSVSIHGVPAAFKMDKSVKEGESFTLDPSARINPNDMATWFFNNTFITKITLPANKICTEDECKEKFGDRLEVDHQTGSLTITKAKTTDSGLYEVEISSHSNRQRRSISSMKSFNVNVIGSSSVLVAGICVAFLLVSALLGVIYFRHRRVIRENRNSMLW